MFSSAEHVADCRGTTAHSNKYYNKNTFLIQIIIHKQCWVVFHLYLICSPLVITSQKCINIIYWITHNYIFFIFLHKYDPKQQQISAVLKVDKENPIKQMRQNIFFVIYLLRKNYPLLNVCALKKYGNLCFQYLV